MSEELQKNGEWYKYKERVFFQLDGLTTQVHDLDQKIDKLHEEVIILKVKSWLFGVVGGSVITAIIQLAIYLVGKGGV